jgi:thiopeptide-type bacteriocin biosynthesis protein
MSCFLLLHFRLPVHNAIKQIETSCCCRRSEVRVKDFDLTYHSSYLPDFLRRCARSLSEEPGTADEPYSREFCQARDAFVRAGIEALNARPWAAGSDWLQIGIHPHDDPGSRRELCQRISSLARKLLADSVIDDFFFMNKLPGMRLRFHGAVAGPGGTAGIVRAEATRWHTEGLVDHVEPGVYEPETQLFGGPRSMKYVHALFTVDSLVWLDYHSRPAVNDAAISPAWLLSLAMLRTVFAGRGITGWGDIGVWDRVREAGGRRLDADKASLPTYPAVADGLRDAWSRRDQILEELHPAVKAVVAHYDSALLAGAARWRSGYFGRPGASLGPRAAAAFYVIFHWNRAALSRTEQMLLTESLSERVRSDASE